MVWFGLVSLFIQGKPLASGYYSRHPETTQYNKDKDKEKRKTEERTQESKSTVAGENSKCSMQQLNIQVSVFIEMRVSQNNNMQLLRIPQGIQIHVVHAVNTINTKASRLVIDNLNLTTKYTFTVDVGTVGAN